MCQENIPDTISPLPPAWTEAGSSGAKFWSYHLCAKISAEIKIYHYYYSYSSSSYYYIRFIFSFQVSSFTEPVLHCRTLVWQKWSQRALLLLKPICLKVWHVVHSERLCCSSQSCRVVIWVTAAYLSPHASPHILLHQQNSFLNSGA